MSDVPELACTELSEVFGRPAQAQVMSARTNLNATQQSPKPSESGNLGKEKIAGTMVRVKDGEEGRERRDKHALGHGVREELHLDAPHSGLTDLDVEEDDRPLRRRGDGRHPGLLFLVPGSLCSLVLVSCYLLFEVGFVCRGSFSKV